jgi:low affinity Fe/Cu permease
MIEKEFGINPDTHEEIGNKFGQEVNNLRETSNEKFSQFVAEAKEQIDHIQTSLRQKRTEYLALKEEFEDEIEKIRKALEEKSQQHIEQIKGADFKRYDEEKAELYAVIRNLEGEIEQFKNNPRNRHTSDLFKDKIRPKKEMKAEKEGEDEEEKKPIDWPLLSQNIIDRLRSEKTKIEKEMLNFKYLFSVEEQNYKRVSDRFKIAINDISFLRDGKTT